MNIHGASPRLLVPKTHVSHMQRYIMTSDILKIVISIQLLVCTVLIEIDLSQSSAAHSLIKRSITQYT